MPEVTLEPKELEQLVRPLRRLKVSLVWQHPSRDGDLATGLRSASAVFGSAGRIYEDMARTYEDVAKKLEVNPEHVNFSTLSLELGTLGGTYDRSTQQRGQASLHFGTCWRVESPRAIAFSSETDQNRTEGELKSFTDRRVLDVQVTGRLPEILVSFSGRRWIQTFGHYGDPSWHIALPDLSWVASKSGRLIRGVL
jgi:hypothetical protein